MSHFARVENSVVVEVIVAEQDFIDSLPNASSWVQTSYNTSGGEHPEGRPLRKNYAGVGYIYDPIRDAFIPPKPFNSWVLDDYTCCWASPVPYPTDGKDYTWDEPTVSWRLIQEDAQ